MSIFWHWFGSEPAKILQKEKSGREAARDRRREQQYFEAAFIYSPANFERRTGEKMQL